MTERKKEEYIIRDSQFERHLFGDFDKILISQLLNVKWVEWSTNRQNYSYVKMICLHHY